jgi:hypothetical protein
MIRKQKGGLRPMPSHENLDLKKNQRNDIHSEGKESFLRKVVNRESQLDQNGNPITGRASYEGLSVNPEVVNKANKMVTDLITKKEPIPQEELLGSVEDILKETPDKPFMKQDEDTSRINNEGEIMIEQRESLNSHEFRRYKIIGWNKDDNDLYGGLPKFYQMEEPGDYIEHKDGHKAFIPSRKYNAAEDFSKMVEDFAPISTTNAKTMIHSDRLVSGWRRARRGHLGYHIEPAPMHIKNDKINKDAIVDSIQVTTTAVRDINERISEEEKSYKISNHSIDHLRSRDTKKIRTGWERSDLPAQEIGRPIVWKALQDEDDRAN